MTAQVFARSFLGNPESLDGIISESKYLLDDSNAAKDQSDAVKRKLKGLLKPGNDIPEWMLAQMGWSAKLPQPHAILQEISTIMERMQRVMRENWLKKDVDRIQKQWCCDDSPMLFRERWEKMFRNFTFTHTTMMGDESDESEVRRSMHHPEMYPDPSWVPALYDSLKYDALHNRPFLQAILTADDDHSSEDLHRLYKLVKIMFDFVAPQEFGITDTEKKNIGMLISFPLLKQILSDLDEMQSAEKAKARLYFTKESHVHALLNLIYLSGVPTKVPRNTLPELDCKLVNAMCADLY